MGKYWLAAWPAVIVQEMVVTPTAAAAAAVCTSEHGNWAARRYPPSDRALLSDTNLSVVSAASLVLVLSNRADKVGNERVNFRLAAQEESLEMRYTLPLRR
jgi:hypothetical protein